MSLKVETFNNLREANCCSNCKFIAYKSWLNPPHLVCHNKKTETTDTLPIYVCDLFEKGDLDD
jgi:hypothetical protein